MRPRRSQANYQGKTKAQILRSDLPNWVKVITPYDADFVNSLKADIAPSHRQWDSTGKFWMVNDTYLDELVKLVQWYYDEVTTDLIDAGDSPSNGPYSAMFLLKEAPDELVKSAYRLLSMAWHPDRGESTEQMTKLNAAYESIKLERGF